MMTVSKEELDPKSHLRYGDPVPVSNPPKQPPIPTDDPVRYHHWHK